MKPALRQLCRVIVLCLTVLVTESIAKPDKPVSSPPPADFSELDKLVTEELKDRIDLHGPLRRQKEVERRNTDVHPCYLSV